MPNVPIELNKALQEFIKGDFKYWINTLPFYMNVEKEGIVLNG